MVSSFARHFSLANIPYGVASSIHHRTNGIVTRLEDKVIFLDVLVDHSFLSDLSLPVQNALKQPLLNEFAALSKSDHLKTRELLQSLLRNLSALPPNSISPEDKVTMHLPLHISDFTDFSCSADHILNVGEVLNHRKLPPQFGHFPLAYSGRTSTIVVSGTDIARPLGMFQPNGPDSEAVFGPCMKLDYELETACIIGRPSKYGKPVSVDEAEDHIFGFVLINDWSARDIMSYEMYPLGPLNSKSFGTTMSPWIITAEAMAPFKTPAVARDSTPSPYLQYSGELSQTNYKWHLHADLIAPDATETKICKARMDWAYWTYKDMIAHQTINGCSLRTGDMLGTGTISGKEMEGRGCLLEVSKGGRNTFRLVNGEERTYLKDGDTIQLTGWAGDLIKSGVGFGDCTGRIIPSPKKFVEQ